MIDEAFERARIAYWHGAKQEYPTPNDRLKAALNVARAIWEEEYEAKRDQIQEQQPADSGTAEAVEPGGITRVPYLSLPGNNPPSFYGHGWAQESRPCRPAMPRTPLSWFRSYRRRRAEQKAMAREIFIGR